MKIIAVSDVHGNFRALKSVLDRSRNADIVVFLGDGERELDRLAADYPNVFFKKVAGNCDYLSTTPRYELFTVEGVKILITHGHEFGVKYGIDRLLRLAKENGAGLVMFGHTHCRLEHYEDGIYFFNPGSVSEPRDGNPPSYGSIDVTPKGILLNTVNV